MCVSAAQASGLSDFIGSMSLILINLDSLKRDRFGIAEMHILMQYRYIFVKFIFKGQRDGLVILQSQDLPQ